jgi:HEAT repeat protein
MKRQRTTPPAVVLLLSAVLGTMAGGAGKANAAQPGNNIEITRLIDILSISPGEEETRRAELDQAIARLRAVGDEAIEPLLDALQKSGNVYLEHRAVSLLRSMGTGRARESLLRIALGRDSPGGVGFGSSWAARNYVQLLEDRSDAKRLLASKDTGVQGVALFTLPGVSIDVALFHQLEGFLQSKSDYLRTRAAIVMATDPETTLVRQKVSAIVKSLETVENLPKAREKFDSDHFGTLADHVYYEFIKALCQMKGADDSLREQAGSTQGNVRVCLLIARGRRGDPSVKSALRTFLKDAKTQTMTMMRSSALHAFEATGTVDDLAFLQEMAQTDPLEVWDFGGLIFEMIDGKLINTGERMAPVPAETDPRWSKARRYYPVRSEAERAIKRIKARRDGLSDFEKDVIEEVTNEPPVFTLNKKRIAKQVEILEKESLQGSVARLDEVEAYFCLPVPERALRGGLPLDPAFGSLEIERILSSRRFRKVFQGISAMPRDAAEALLNTEIQASLASYQGLFDEYVRENEPYFRWVTSGSPPDSGGAFMGPAFQIGNNPDGSPTLMGMRLKLLSLLLLTANLGLDGTKETVRTVVDKAVSQRQPWYANPFKQEGVGANARAEDVSLNLLASAGLYNRQILATAVLRTNSDKNTQERVLQAVNGRMTRKKLALFNAEVTEYDLLGPAHSGLLPVDYSKGSFEIEYLEPISDSTFDAIVRRP